MKKQNLKLIKLLNKICIPCIFDKTPSYSNVSFIFIFYFMPRSRVCPFFSPLLLIGKANVNVSFSYIDGFRWKGFPTSIQILDKYWREKFPFFFFTNAHNIEKENFVQIRSCQSVLWRTCECVTFHWYCLAMNWCQWRRRWCWSKRRKEFVWMGFLWNILHISVISSRHLYANPLEYRWREAA